MTGRRYIQVLFRIVGKIGTIGLGDKNWFYQATHLNSIVIIYKYQYKLNAARKKIITQGTQWVLLIPLKVIVELQWWNKLKSEESSVETIIFRNAKALWILFN